ncbi:VWA domain-containing protein, partial [bacterium]|nr:VWA domain-containing protein [bacterium]
MKNLTKLSIIKSSLKMITILFLISTCLFLADTHADTTSDITNTGQGSLRTIINHGNEPTFLDLPLEHTSVNARVSGFIARVDVTQTFTNNQHDTIEAIYVFPLPDNSAVDAMSMTIGQRTIKGVIKKRQEAEQIYQQARASGQTAALLTQERPNIFTQSVANVLPGDRIDVHISYVQDLKYDRGEYEFNFPMVVGPRFIPNSVPDASRISPPVLRPNERSGHDIDVTLFIDAGVPIENLHSPSHRVAQDHDYDNSATITLDPSDSIPNKDFIVRYDVTGKRPIAALQTHNDDNGGFFSLMIQPQGEFTTREIISKEMVFVVDCSGSMSGAPMAQAKALMRKAIQEMNPDDSFQIIRFSSAASQFSPMPLPNTPSNIHKALAYINAMKGGGGTRMIEGIKAALNYPSDPERLRMVLFLTDGYIGNEAEIFGEIEKRIGNTRLFSLGVGSSVNHYLLDRMAEAGRGFVQYVRPDEDTQPAVKLFYDRIRNPLLTNICIDWDGLDIKDVYPALIPDLFSDQPVILHGRFGKAGRGTVTITGTMNGRAWEQEINVILPRKEPANDVLATLWARTRIKNLMNRLNQGHRRDIEQEITELALQYNLMSKYTAFVAVTEEVRRDP